MPLWVVELRWWIAAACLVGLGVLLLGLVFAGGLKALFESKAGRAFLKLPNWAKCASLCVFAAFVAWAGDKPEQEVVRGIKLESVDVTSTNATLKYYAEDTTSHAAVTVTNRTAWIYKRGPDNTWRLVLEVGAQTGSEFITTVNGFFPGTDNDWKVIMSGEDGEESP